ncbi:MAG: PIN domain-containing protein [Chloroflexota bacterium]
MASASDPRPRVLIDSSVLLAGSPSSTGTARDLLLAGVRGDILRFVSPLVPAETERNLHRKAPAGLPAFREFRQLLEQHLVDPPTVLVLQVAQHIEIKDAPIVAAAIVARASHLVTFDRKHLLSHAALIKHHYHIETVIPDVVLGLRSPDLLQRPDG